MGKNKKQSLTDKTFGGFLIMFASSSAQVFLRVIFMSVLSRILTPEDFGLVAIATMITGFAELFIQLGVGPALVQLKILTEKHIRTGFTFSLMNGILMTVIFYLLSPFIADFFEMPELLEVLHVIVWIFPVRTISKISYNLLQRELQFKKLAGNEVISYVVGFGTVGIPMALMGYGYMSLIWGSLIQAIIYSIILFYYQPHKLKLKIDRPELKELISFGAYFSLSNIFSFFAMQGDYFVIGKLMGASSLGYYNRAYKLMNMSNTMVGSIMNKVLFPGFSKIQGDKDKAGIALRRSYNLIFMVFIPVSSLAVILAPEVIIILLGKQWYEVIPIFQILATGMMLRVGFKIGSSFARGSGMVKSNALIQFVYFVNVVLGAYIGSFYGLTAVAFLVTIALLINFILLTNIAVKYSTLQWQSIIKDFFLLLITHLPITLLLYACTHWLRSLELSLFVILIIILLLWITIIILLLKYKSKLILGRNDQWINEEMKPKLLKQLKKMKGSDKK
jgi:O-antigen/teichoic acid export membrane protein